jgi:hypothetical protein
VPEVACSFYDALTDSIRCADLQALHSSSNQTWIQAVLMVVGHVLTCNPLQQQRAKLLDLALALVISFTELLVRVPEGKLFWELLTRWVEEGTLEETYAIAEQWEDIGRIFSSDPLPDWLLPLITRHAVAITCKCKFQSISNYFEKLEDCITTISLRMIASEALLTLFRLHSQANQAYTFLQVFGHLLSSDLFQRELFVFVMRSFAPAMVTTDSYFEGVSDS